MGLKYHSLLSHEPAFSGGRFEKYLTHMSEFSELCFTVSELCCCVYYLCRLCCSMCCLCKCVLYYYHRVSTQLQLNISYHIMKTNILHCLTKPNTNKYMWDGMYFFRHFIYMFLPLSNSYYYGNGAQCEKSSTLRTLIRRIVHLSHIFEVTKFELGVAHYHNTASVTMLYLLTTIS